MWRGVIITVIVFYVLHVCRESLKLRKRNEKIKKWGLVEGQYYMIQNKSGFWFKACFIDSFFKLSDSSFRVELEDVYNVKEVENNGK